MASKFEVLKRRLSKLAAYVRQNVQAINLLTLKDRSGMPSAGAFLLAVVLLLAGVVAYADFRTAASNDRKTQAQSASINLQTSQNASSNNDAANNLAPSSQVDSTSQSTDDSNGTSSSSAQVTVNGQNIPVPANGTVSQTMNNANGQTTVNVSSNQSGGSNNTSNHLHVTTHSTSINTEVNNVTN